MEPVQAYCFYENSSDPAYQKKWGALYTWHVVNTGKLAPEGWRVPSEADWDTLRNYLIANKYNCDGSTTGNAVSMSMRLKAEWERNDYSAAYINHEIKINSSGFSAYPGGQRMAEGDFKYQNRHTYWWSTTDGAASDLLLYTPLAVARTLSYLCDDFAYYSSDKRDGLSVRLVRDIQ